MRGFCRGVYHYAGASPPCEQTEAPGVNRALEVTPARHRPNISPPQLPPWTGLMTGLSLRLWHDGRLVPVEGGGAQIERLRAPVIPPPSLRLPGKAHGVVWEHGETGLSCLFKLPHTHLPLGCTPPTNNRPPA